MTGSEDYKGPLVGLNVVDFGHYFAGPMAAMLLADQGANVVHIQRPGAPELKEQQYRSLNRNKKILTLDLKSDEGLAQAKALIAKADVVVENFRPGVMKRLGLDYASLKPLNPGLIYLSLPGFASTDKENAHIQAWEGVMSAAMGLYTMTSEVRRPNNFPPLYTWTPICSGYGAMNGAGAVMAALIARREHGVGTMIEVPLVDAGMTAFEADFLMKGGGAVPLRKYPTPSSAGRKKRENPNAYEPGDSIEVQKEKLSRATKRRLFQTYGFIIFKCGDGRGLMLSSKSWKVLEILGIKDEVKKRGFVVESPWEIGLGNNAHGYLTDERKAELLGLIEDALKAKPAEEWEKLIQDAGGHASVVRTRDEWLSLAPHAESGMVNTLEDKETTLYVPGRLSGISGPGDTPISRKLYDAVEISFSDAEELFSGYEVPTGTPPKTPLRKGDLLKGLKVLDMSNVVAGPSISVHLAEYGAEIIRSDPPIPTHYSPGIHPMVLLMNQGKRSIVSDMTTAPGREIFRKLVN